MKHLDIRLPVILVSLPLSVMSVLLPFYTDAIGLTPLQTTGLFSVFSLTLLVARFFLGKAADRFGRRPLFLLGVVCYAGAYCLYALAGAALLFYLARMIQAAAAALLYISTYSIISDRNEENHAESFGLLESYANTGGLIGIVVCFLVFRQFPFSHSWTYLFLLCAGAAALALVVSLRTVRETKNRDEASSRPHGNPPSRALGQAALLINSLAAIFTSLVGAVFVLYLLRRFNATLDSIAIAFLLPAVLIPYAAPGLGKLAGRLGEWRAAFFALAATALCVAALPAAGTILLYGVAWTAYCLSAALLGISLDSAYTKATGPHSRGRAIGIYSVGAAAGGIVGPLAGGFLFEWVGGASPYLFGAAGTALLAACTGLFYRSNVKSSG